MSQPQARESTAYPPWLADELDDAAFEWTLDELDRSGDLGSLRSAQAAADELNE